MRDLETADELTAVVTVGPSPGIRLFPLAPLFPAVPGVAAAAATGVAEQGDSRDEEEEDGMTRSPAGVEDEESAPP